MFRVVFRTCLKSTDYFQYYLGELKVLQNFAAPNALAEVVKMINHIGLWDAKLTWYSPSMMAHFSFTVYLLTGLCKSTLSLLHRVRGNVSKDKEKKKSNSMFEGVNSLTWRGMCYFWSSFSSVPTSMHLAWILPSQIQADHLKH